MAPRPPSSSSSELSPPPPRNAATSLAVAVPYFCPKHFALATYERPLFPLFLFKRCPDCRLDGIHERDLLNYCSAPPAPPPGAPSSSRTPPPPSPLDSLECVLLFSSRSSTVWIVLRQTGLRSVTVESDTTVACAVCTDDLPPAVTARQLPCGHLYHADCFVQWLSRRNSCPVCRCRVPEFPDHVAPTPSKRTHHRRRLMIRSRRRPTTGGGLCRERAGSAEFAAGCFVTWK